MLAAIAPAAVRRVHALTRVAPLPGVGEWSTAGADRAPLLVLWDTLVPQSRVTAGPLWSRLSSSSSGSGRDGDGAGGASGRSEGSGKEGETGIKEQAGEEGAVSESGSGDNGASAGSGKGDESGKGTFRRRGLFNLWKGSGELIYASLIVSLCMEISF